MKTSILLSNTLGKLQSKYKILDEWIEVYKLLLDSRPICENTKGNRKSALNHISRHLGGKTVGSIKPHDIALLMQELQDKPQNAKRVLFEAKDLFNEAIGYGWIDRNPALQIRPPITRVTRKRLSLDPWWLILEWSINNQPPWVSRMIALALVTGQRRSDLVKMKFSDIWNGHLHVEQAKTSARIALPIKLRLNVVGLSLGDIVGDCTKYSANSEYLVHKNNGDRLGDASLSARFEEARDAVLPYPTDGTPSSLHECRSLSERLYRVQGIDTMRLLGHKHQSMTDMYNDDRGLSSNEWKILAA